MSKPNTLEQQAQEFAGRLSKTVEGIFKSDGSFRSRASVEEPRFVIEQENKSGIPLLVDGNQVLSLKVSYKCQLDGEAKFLAVEESNITVYAGDKPAGEPIFRYEYLREPTGKIPAAHIHLHAHRDAFTAAMVRAGTSTSRGRRRASDTGVPALKEIHFPVGGRRFRPSLEDILEMLIEEFGIDRPDNFRQMLREGRSVWRRIQTKAVVRDDPQSAIEALDELGYDVLLRSDEVAPCVRSDRLEEL